MNNPSNSSGVTAGAIEGATAGVTAGVLIELDRSTNSTMIAQYYNTRLFPVKSNTPLMKNSQSLPVTDENSYQDSTS